MAGRKRILIEVHGVIAPIEEHIEMLGYNRTTLYNKAKRKGMTLEQYLNSLPPGTTRVSHYEPRADQDPFTPGYPWDIRGCENMIIAVFKREFNEMVDAVDLYTQFPTERHRQTVLYHEQWFLDAIPNYYDCDPQKIVDWAKQKGREQARKHMAGRKAQKGLLSRRERS